MSQTSGGDGANIDLADSLLLKSKYNRIWLYTTRFVILLKKQKTANGTYESPPPPQSSFPSVPYTSLPPSEPSVAVNIASLTQEESSLPSVPCTSLPPSEPSVAVNIASLTQEESSLPSVPCTSLPPSEPSVAIDIGSVAQEEGEEQRIRNDVERKEQDINSLPELDGDGQRQHSQESTIDNGDLGMSGTPIPVHRTSFSSFLLNSCKHNCYTISMLLISAGLSFATEFRQEGPRYGWHDGVAIVFAVLLLVAFSSITDFWRERQMMKLAKRKGKLKFTVQRGQESLVALAISDIVVGDIVCLNPGDEVPADGLLVRGDIISVMHEATKSNIDREAKPFLRAGSKVIEGNGWMLVESVGNKRNLAKKKRGPLERLIEKPISDIDKVALFISTLVAFVVFIRLICKKDVDSNGMPEIKGKISVGLLMEALERMFLRPQGRISILTGLVTVVILCVQHGMPLMVTVSLNYQANELRSEQDAVLNDPLACATMGLVTVICIDVPDGIISKPGEVSRILMGETDISKAEGSEIDIVVPDLLKQGVGLSVHAPELSLSPMFNSPVSEKFKVLRSSKLNSDKDGNGVLVRKVGGNEQILHLHWSGDASTILEMCSRYYGSKGEWHVMENQKIKFGQMIKEMEDSGLKPIAFAHKQTEVEELEQDELFLLGLIGLKYTFQESTKLALEELKNTKIQLILVSEDNIMLVKNIVCELGIEVSVDGNDRVLEGKELQDLNGEARLNKVDGAIVMGSFCPEDKLLMVRCLQDKDHVVAYIGRRFSDTSVVKEADVGIVHNSLSRIVDGESDISIKCFSALKPIVRAGRSKYHNIQKFIQLQLTCIISGSLITLITTIFTGESPLTAIQLIWVNMLMCLLGSLMMVMELNIKKILDEKPSKRNQPIITKQIWKSIVIQVLCQALVCMMLEFGGDVTDSEKRVRKTMIFNTFLLCQIFNLLDTIHLWEKEVLKIVVQSYCFLVALGGCFLVQVLVIEYAKGLSDCMKLNATQWAICFLVGALSWVYGLALKYLLRANCASESNTLPLDSPNSTRPAWFYLHGAFPFLVLFSFPVGLMFNQIGIAFRYTPIDLVPFFM